MKKLQMILFSAALAGSHQTHALINDGKFGDPGELFISVYDEAGQKSYYKDLGVNMAQFLAGQGCFEGNLGADPNFASFLGKSGLLYNIAAVNPLVKDAAGIYANLTAWGYLATSSQGAAVFNASFNAIDNPKQKIQAYIGNLNVVAFTNAPGEAAQNTSGVFGPTDPGYHGSPFWGSTMGRSVSGSTEGVLDQPLEFYFVNNSNGTDSGKQVSKLGAWILTSAGQLGYNGAGTAAVCVSGSGSANRAPSAAVANPNQTATVGSPVILDGSGSSDADSGPQPLAYSWKLVSGPVPVILGNADQARASFTPAKRGTYVFELSVSDGMDSAKAQATVTAIRTGAFIEINAPSAWKVKKRQAIGWSTQQVDPKMLVKIQFSRNGGAKYKALKSIASKKARFVWKPVKANATAQGALRLCVKPNKKTKTPVCDQLNITVQR